MWQAGAHRPSCHASKSTHATPLPAPLCCLQVADMSTLKPSSMLRLVEQWPGSGNTNELVQLANNASNRVGVINRVGGNIKGVVGRKAAQ